MDGASGQQTTRQKWSKNNDVHNDNATKRMKISDETVFMVSMVPLQLKADDSIIWENKTPSSVH